MDTLVRLDPRSPSLVSRELGRPLERPSRAEAEQANRLDRVLAPQGVAVVIEGAHGCMTSRGVGQSATTMVTSRMLGVFRDRLETRQEFLAAIDLRNLSWSGGLAA